MDAGELRERMLFSSRSEVDDGYGNTVGGFEARFTVWAKIQPLRGGEEVMGQRLQGVQPVVIIVRYSSDTAKITSDWEATDTRTGVVYALQAIANEDRRKQYLSIVATAGKAA